MVTWVRTRVAVTLMASSVVVITSGCGGGDNPSAAATSAVKQFYASLGAGNAAAVCGTLSASGKQQLVADLEELGGAATCVEAASKARDVLSAYLGDKALTRLATAQPRDAVVSGQSATAVVPFSGLPGQQTVQLVKEKTGWKVNRMTGDAKTSGTGILPALPGDQRPRVEGKWRVVYTGGPDDPTRTTWHIKSKCEVGACSFVGKSSFRDSKFPLHFDKTVGDYTFRDKRVDPCIEDGSNAVRAERGYEYNDRWNVRVTKAVLARGQQFATEMRGDRSTTVTVTDEGLAKNCTEDSTFPRYEQARFVRITPPTGEDIKVSNSGDPSNAGAGGE